MTTVEDELREMASGLGAGAGAGGAGGVGRDLPPAAEIMRRGSRRRRRRRASRAAVAVTAAVVVGGFGLSRVSSGPSSDDGDVVTSPADRPPDTSAPPSTTPTTTTTAVAPGPGVDLIVMPDIVGLDVDRASEVLQSVGLRVVVRGPDGDGPGSTVVTQEPAAGAQVEVGADVHVTARREGP